MNLSEAIAQARAEGRIDGRAELETELAHAVGTVASLTDERDRLITELARVREELAKASGEEHADRCAQSKRLKEMLKAERERTERVARLLYYLLFTQSTQFKENAR